MDSPRLNCFVAASAKPAHAYAALAALGEGESLLARFAAAMTGGAATALVGAPFDAVKTRLMNQNQQALYAGPLDCAARVARVEGAAALWKGLLPVYCRQGPFNVLNYLIMEQLTLSLLGRSV